MDATIPKYKYQKYSSHMFLTAKSTTLNILIVMAFAKLGKQNTEKQTNK